MNEFDQLVRQHLELQGRVTRDPAGINLAEVESLLAATRAAGGQVAAVEQRDHLRAILRNWGAFIYEKTGEYPATQLEPYDGRNTEPDEKGAVSTTIFPPSAAPAPQEKALSTLETMPSTGTAAKPPATPSRPAHSGYLANPLTWLLILAFAAIVLIALALPSLFLLSRSDTPTAEGTTGIPPEILGPITESGAAWGIEVTRPPETVSSDVDFILTVRPEATLQDLAAALQTNVATLQALNPALSGLPRNGTLLALVGQPVEGAQLVVTSLSATLFDQPDRQAQSVTNLQSGSFAPVLGRTTDYDWYWVNTQQGTGWLAGQDTGLIYPTVPDSLPIIARIQLIPDTAVENDNDD